MRAVGPGKTGRHPVPRLARPTTVLFPPPSQQAQPELQALRAPVSSPVCQGLKESIHSL